MHQGRPNGEDDFYQAPFESKRKRIHHMSSIGTSRDAPPKKENTNNRKTKEEALRQMRTNATIQESGENKRIQILTT
jgi:hypothetical protein